MDHKTEPSSSDDDDCRLVLGPQFGRKLKRPVKPQPDWDAIKKARNDFNDIVTFLGESKDYEPKTSNFDAVFEIADINELLEIAPLSESWSSARLNEDQNQSSTCSVEDCRHNKPSMNGEENNNNPFRTSRHDKSVDLTIHINKPSPSMIDYRSILPKQGTEFKVPNPVGPLPINRNAKNKNQIKTSQPQTTTVALPKNIVIPPPKAPSISNSSSSASSKSIKSSQASVTSSKCSKESEKSQKLSNSSENSSPSSKSSIGSKHSKPISNSSKSSIISSDDADSSIRQKTNAALIKPEETEPNVDLILISNDDSETGASIQTISAATLTKSVSVNEVKMLTEALNDAVKRLTFGYLKFFTTKNENINILDENDAKLMAEGRFAVQNKLKRRKFPDGSSCLELNMTILTTIFSEAPDPEGNPDVNDGKEEKTENENEDVEAPTENEILSDCAEPDSTKPDSPNVDTITVFSESSECSETFNKKPKIKKIEPVFKNVFYQEETKFVDPNQPSTSKNYDPCCVLAEPSTSKIDNMDIQQNFGSELSANRMDVDTLNGSKEYINDQLRYSVDDVASPGCSSDAAFNEHNKVAFKEIRSAVGTWIKQCINNVPNVAPIIKERDIVHENVMHALSKKLRTLYNNCYDILRNKKLRIIVPVSEDPCSERFKPIITLSSLDGTRRVTFNDGDMSDTNSNLSIDENYRPTVQSYENQDEVINISDDEIISVSSQSLICDNIPKGAPRLPKGPLCNSPQDFIEISDSEQTPNYFLRYMDSDTFSEDSIRNLIINVKVIERPKYLIPRPPTPPRQREHTSPTPSSQENEQNYSGSEYSEQQGNDQGSSVSEHFEQRGNDQGSSVSGHSEPRNNDQATPEEGHSYEGDIDDLLNVSDHEEAENDNGSDIYYGRRSENQIPHDSRLRRINDDDISSSISDLDSDGPRPDPDDGQNNIPSPSTTSLIQNLSTHIQNATIPPAPRPNINSIQDAYDDLNQSFLRETNPQQLQTTQVLQSRYEPISTDSDVSMNDPQQKVIRNAYPIIPRVYRVPSSLDITPRGYMMTAPIEAPVQQTMDYGPNYLRSANLMRMPTDQNTSPPINHQNHNPPINHQNHNPPMNHQNHNPPINHQNHNPPINHQNHNPQMNHQNHNPPMNHQNHNPPMNHQNYNPPMNHQNHNPQVEHISDPPPNNEPQRATIATQTIETPIHHTCHPTIVHNTSVSIQVQTREESTNDNEDNDDGNANVEWALSDSENSNDETQNQNQNGEETTPQQDRGVQQSFITYFENMRAQHAAYQQSTMRPSHRSLWLRQQHQLETMRRHSVHIQPSTTANGQITHIRHHLIHNHPPPQQQQQEGSSSTVQGQITDPYRVSVLLSCFPRMRAILNVPVGAPNGAGAGDDDEATSAPQDLRVRRNTGLPRAFNIVHRFDGMPGVQTLNSEDDIDEDEDPLAHSIPLQDLIDSTTVVFNYDGTTPEERCNICLSDYVAEEILRRLPCFHTYHRHCIDQWLGRERRTCPNCRTYLTSHLSFSNPNPNPNSSNPNPNSSNPNPNPSNPNPNSSNPNPNSSNPNPPNPPTSN